MFKICMHEGISGGRKAPCAYLVRDDAFATTTRTDMTRSTPNSWTSSSLRSVYLPVLFLALLAGLVRRVEVLQTHAHSDVRNATNANGRNAYSAEQLHCRKLDETALTREAIASCPTEATNYINNVVMRRNGSERRNAWRAPKDVREFVDLVEKLELMTRGLNSNGNSSESKSVRQQYEEEGLRTFRRYFERRIPGVSVISSSPVIYRRLRTRVARMCTC